MGQPGINDSTAIGNLERIGYGCRFGFMVFNATFNNNCYIVEVRFIGSGNNTNSSKVVMLHHLTYYPIPTQPVLLLLLAEKKEISILFSLVLLHRGPNPWSTAPKNKHINQYTTAAVKSYNVYKSGF